jgi:hemerythrin-like metal-binding protein
MQEVKMIPAEGQSFPLLGVPEMDQTHEEFVKYIALVETAADADVLARLLDLITHTAEHFGQEKEWMESMNFPQIGCNNIEHDGVMQVMAEAQRYVEEGKYEVGRVLARELGEWFRTHAATMDAMLAYALSNKGESAASCGDGACSTHAPQN